MSASLDKSLVAVSAFLVAAVAAGHAVNERLDGEYGLWVRQLGEDLEAHWITQEPGPGYLRVVAGERVVFDVTTDSARAHQASFAYPTAKEITLHYGGVDDPQDSHETTLHLGSEARDKVSFVGVDSLFVFGDTHGEYETVVQVLTNAGLVDEEGDWYGGEAHLVFLGDLFDRGPDVTRLLWFVYGLERQAERAGGRVHTVLGNHEIMVMTDDLRYVSGKEQRLASLYGTTYSKLFDSRESVLAKWLSTKPALIRIDDLLLTHGSVGPEYTDYSLGAFDDSLAAFMSEPLFHWYADTTVAVPPMDSTTLYRHYDFFFGENSVFWFRGYAYTDTLGAALERALSAHDSRIHVIGHTAFDSIGWRYDGKLLTVDLREPAEEMVLLVREGREYEAYVYGLEGEAKPLPVPAQVGSR